MTIKTNLPFAMAICGLDELADELEALNPTHVISILDPGEDDHDPLVFPESIRVLSIRFFDIHAMGGVVGTMLSARDKAEYPCIDHAQAILEFGRNIPCGSRVLVHCWAGVSRSTAAAYLLACLHLPPNDAMNLILSLRQGAMPNRLIVRFADKALGAEGRMLAAIDDQRRGVDRRSIRSSRR
ncbi:MAG: hypothetical protein Q7R40_19245 [Phaeospirillum sp.]|nr:hypothetical protein [Phaeospirillum sp.]